ncbi:uncharacterized protein LOC108477879 [Gossypium arboreum]|uniref:uncharacterized protein LOC108477879 n=1 Tax=Gossypium arboreum TaxID=29729 RepID=UPI0008191699|nr:uncharacterized protein LOC108477879 [Gossypium arboreum]
MNAQCEYHAGITGPSIENCITFKKLVERLIKMGIVKFDDTSSVENLLLDHANKRVNAIIDNTRKRIKMNIAEVKTLLREVWKKMVERWLIIEFRALVQGLIDNKELEFFKYAKGLEGEDVTFPYKDSKRVPWNYNCNVTISREENPISASEEGRDVGFYMRSRRRYDPSNTKAEPAKGKALAVEQKKENAHSEYSVVEQLYKQPARISVLAFLLSSEAHRSVLIKVLNETYVANDISINKLDRLVSNISANNFISFNDHEIPPGDMGSTKALHITTHCKGYTLPKVLSDNRSTLNVLPLSTLNRLPVDNSHIKTCQNIVRAFDGTERKVMGRIEVPFLIGPNTYEVDFLVMDIKPSYNCLLGKPWIHSIGAVPSTFHQKLKLVTEGRLVMINVEEDIIASVTSNVPYIGADDKAIECSFLSLEFVIATFIIEGNKIPMPRIFKATKMGLRLTVRKGSHTGKKGSENIFKEKSRCEAKEEKIGEEAGKEKNTGGIIHPERKMTRKETAEEMMGNLNINAISRRGNSKRNLSGIFVYVPGSFLNNWTVEEIPDLHRGNAFLIGYGIEAVLPINIEISSLRVLSKLKLDKAKWIQP